MRSGGDPERSISSLEAHEEQVEAMSHIVLPNGVSQMNVVTADQTFWIPQRFVEARAMREYRSLWAACPEYQQHSLRLLILELRIQGWPERDIGNHLKLVLDRLRPWRMSDAKLNRALRKRFRARSRRREAAGPL